MCKVERKSRVSYIKVTVSYKVQLVSIYKTVSGAQGGGGARELPDGRPNNARRLHREPETSKDLKLQTRLVRRKDT